ncbi:SDR family NAD(P)-dependent oxidoreductase [Quadrisphaera granulorum]|uniref:SDR family NAD(P)-dependent oxidoreductase n=1 Tax=Quadrisphaera granulorum TaxID=317664 RepID=UPI001FEC7FB3|nr:SDR family oxidoreductase [Quadrisphaera granulorum]
MCLRLAARGDMVVAADRDGVGLAETVRLVEMHAGSAVAVELDVTDAAAVRAAVTAADTCSAARRLTTAVACAGVARRTAALTLDARDADAALADLDLTLAVNVRGTFLLLQAAAAVMAPRGEGSIVTVASTSAFTASSTPMLAYDASKGAVKMLTQAAARELGPHGVRVNGVAPGTMDTPLMRALGADDAALSRMVQSRIPLGRLGGVSEVAEVVAWLSSPQASYVTGQLVVADGGWLA